jgi:hypothetical protein
MISDFFSKLHELKLRNNSQPYNNLANFLIREKSVKVVDSNILKGLVEESKTNCYLQSFSRQKRKPENKNKTPVINFLFTNQDEGMT